MTIEVSQLTDYLDELLKVRQIKDFCPNGLQVAGKSHVKRIMTGVTASQALVDAAVAAGLPLPSGPYRVSGRLQRRGATSQTAAGGAGLSPRLRISCCHLGDWNTS